MSETLPQGWATAYLMDLIELYDNKRIPLNGQQRLTMQGHYPYYGANGQVDSINDYLFEGDFVLLAEDGGYFENPLRGVAYEVSGKFWVNNHAHILKPKNEIPLRFLKHKLNNINWMEYVGGSTRLKLTQQAMHKIQFPLPPLAEQQRIVAKLEALLTRSTNVRNELAAIPKLIERYKQAVLAAAFRGDLTADWRGTSELMGWEKSSIGKVAKGIVSGRTKPKSFSGDIPWITLPDFSCVYLSKSNKGYAVTREEAESVGMKVIPKNAVLMSCVGEFGIVGIADCELVPNQQIHAFICNSNVIPEFLYFSLINLKEYMENIASATTVAYLNAQKCNNLPLILPPIKEQGVIVERIETAFKAIDTIEAELTQAEALRKRLEQATLAKAFRGELVSQNPTDEPASVLLERIRAEREAQPKSTKGRRGKHG